MDWFTADYHLGETRFDLMGRPFTSPVEMAIALENNHNKLVSKDDTVHFVGDVVYQKAENPLYWLEQIKHFNGKKILYRGNHDRIFDDETLLQYFDKIYGEEESGTINVGDKSFNITHYPTNGNDSLFNLVGHIHAAWKVQLNMLNVGVDVHHFRPINTEQVQFMLNAITKFYDEDVWVAYRTLNSSYRLYRGVNGRYLNSLIPLPSKEELKDLYQKTFDETTIENAKCSWFVDNIEYWKRLEASEAVYKKLFVDAINNGYFKDSKIIVNVNSDQNIVTIHMILPSEISLLCDYLSGITNGLKSKSFKVMHSIFSLSYGENYHLQITATYEDCKMFVSNFGEVVNSIPQNIHSLQNIVAELELTQYLNCDSKKSTKIIC